MCVGQYIYMYIIIMLTPRVQLPGCGLHPELPALSGLAELLPVAGLLSLFLVLL